MASAPADIFRGVVMGAGGVVTGGGGVVMGGGMVMSGGEVMERAPVTPRAARRRDVCRLQLCVAEEAVEAGEGAGNLGQLWRGRGGPPECAEPPGAHGLPRSS